MQKMDVRRSNCSFRVGRLSEDEPQRHHRLRVQVQRLTHDSKCLALLVPTTAAATFAFCCLFIDCLSVVVITIVITLVIITALWPAVYWSARGGSPAIFIVFFGVPTRTQAGCPCLAGKPTWLRVRQATSELI